MSRDHPGNAYSVDRGVVACRRRRLLSLTVIIEGELPRAIALSARSLGDRFAVESITKHGAARSRSDALRQTWMRRDQFDLRLCVGYTKDSRRDASDFHRSGDRVGNVRVQNGGRCVAHKDDAGEFIWS